MTTAATLPTRDHPGYWRRRPADHGADGLYREGPHMARGCLAGLIGVTVSTSTPPSPAQALHERAQVRRRALARQATPAPTVQAAGDPRFGDRRRTSGVRCLGRRSA